MRFMALGVYILIAVSDIFDGYIARQYNQRTRLGERLDPLADKLAVNLGFVFIAANPAFSPALPLWFPVFILARDVAIVMGAFGIKRYHGRVHIAPLFLGKLSTVFQMSTIIGALLGVFFLHFLMWATVAISVVSGLGYFKMGYRQMTAGGRA